MLNVLRLAVAFTLGTAGLFLSLLSNLVVFVLGHLLTVGEPALPVEYVIPEDKENLRSKSSKSRSPDTRRLPGTTVANHTSISPSAETSSPGDSQAVVTPQPVPSAYKESEALETSSVGSPGSSIHTLPPDHPVDFDSQTREKRRRHRFFPHHHRRGQSDSSLGSQKSERCEHVKAKLGPVCKRVSSSEHGKPLNQRHRTDPYGAPFFFPLPTSDKP